MEAMTPWLLLIIAALIVACVSLYFHLRQVESQSRGEQSIITDELREAEAALTSALEKIHRIDRELGAREKTLADPMPAAAPSESRMRVPEPPVDPSLRPGAEFDPETPAARTEIRLDPHGSGKFDSPPVPADPGEGTLPPQSERRGNTSTAGERDWSLTDWRDRAAEMAQDGMTPRQIARALELPVGEVEFALALRSSA
jgi:hypothetical protein